MPPCRLLTSRRAYSIDDVGLGDLNLVLFNWNVDGGVLTNDWINQRPTFGITVGLDEFNGVLFS